MNLLNPSYFSTTKGKAAAQTHKKGLSTGFTSLGKSKLLPLIVKIHALAPFYFFFPNLLHSLISRKTT